MVNDSHDGLEYSQRVISTRRNDWFADTTACGATTLATPARELIAPRKVRKGRERDVIGSPVGKSSLSYPGGPEVGG